MAWRAGAWLAGPAPVRRGVVCHVFTISSDLKQPLRTESVISHTKVWQNDQVYEFLAGIKFVCHADTAFARCVIL